MNAVYKKYAMSIALVWTGCFILSLFIYMIVIAPQIKYKKQVDQQLTDKKQMYEAVLKINQQATQIRLNKQMEQWKNKLKDFVAVPEDLAGLTFDIGQIAKDTQVDSFSIRSQSIRESQDSGGQYICENQMNVNFKADFNKFAAFLNAMERHQPVIFVDRFKIAHSDQDDSVSQVSMDLSVFVKKQQGI